MPAVVGTLGDVYPELPQSQARITTWLEQEEKQFAETLERAWAPLMDAITQTRADGLQTLPGEQAFRLHDTYGLPKEIAAEVAAEHGLGFDEQGFNAAMESQRQRARARAQQDFAFGVRSGYQDFVGRTRFLGYDLLEASGVVIGIVNKGEPAEILRAGEEGEVFLDQTPFYAEGGGQVGDTGRIFTADGTTTVATVEGTFRPVEGAHAHRVVKGPGTLRIGQEVRLVVDRDRRRAIQRAHTATHLLHLALRFVLGQHATQSGSLVDADRLRFDFAHFSALTDEQISTIENLVFSWSLLALPLRCRQMKLDEARAEGATALFGEKYGDTVRVVEFSDGQDVVSKELCGGTHAEFTSHIGGFAIISETSIGAGLRRIEAVTGTEAHALMARQREALASAAAELGCQPSDVGDSILKLEDELRQARREIARLQRRSAAALADDLLHQVVQVGPARVLAARIEGLSPDALRTLADKLRAQLGSAVVVLGCLHQGRPHFICAVTPDLVSAGYHAGNLLREVAKVAGGGGGGRPDFAQAGGKDPERLDDALAKVKALVAAQQL